MRPDIYWFVSICSCLTQLVTKRLLYAYPLKVNVWKLLQPSSWPAHTWESMRRGGLWRRSDMRGDWGGGDCGGAAIWRGGDCGSAAIRFYLKMRNRQTNFIQWFWITEFLSRENIHESPTMQSTVNSRHSKGIFVYLSTILGEGGERFHSLPKLRRNFHQTAQGGNKLPLSPIIRHPPTF